MSTKPPSQFSEYSLPVPLAVGDSEVTLLTCPSGGRIIIDNVLIYGKAASTLTFRKYSGAPTDSAANDILSVEVTEGAPAGADNIGGLVLTNGQVLAVIAADASAAAVDVIYRKER